MKKSLMILAIAAIAASTAVAKEHGKRGDKSEKGKCDKPMVAAEQCPGFEGKMAMRGERPGGAISPELMEKMREEHRAIRELGQAIRAESDEAKKAELTVQLREKLGAIADQIQAQQAQRLAQAEERLENIKEKVAEGQDKRDELIEQHLQRILSGERPERHGGFERFPNAKGQKKQGQAQ